MFTYIFTISGVLHIFLWIHVTALGHFVLIGRTASKPFFQFLFFEKHFCFAFIFLIAVYKIRGWQFFVPARYVCCPTPFVFPGLW